MPYPFASTIKVTRYSSKASIWIDTDLQPVEISGVLGHPGYVTLVAEPRAGEETWYLVTGQLESSV